MINWETTHRGFSVGRFKDRYDKAASIQRSSIAFEDCLWLGCDDPTVILNNMPTTLPDNYKILARMHLNRELAADLWPVLKAFAETGMLNGDYTNEETSA